MVRKIFEAYYGFQKTSFSQNISTSEFFFSNTLKESIS